MSNVEKLASSAASNELSTATFLNLAPGVGIDLNAYVKQLASSSVLSFLNKPKCLSPG